ncbi:MAG: ABC transporter permease [Actinomycetota bacterium]
MRAVQMVRRNRIVYWRASRMSFLFAVLVPVMFLSAMGFGLGSMVEENESFRGVAYLAFFGTGILSATAMQAGVFEGSYPIMAKIIWQRNYEAILASPLSTRDIFIGELMWVAALQAQTATGFLIALSIFDVIGPLDALLVLPVVVLLGVACASVVMAYTATLQTDEAYTWLFRLVVTPLFLLSGTFFPIAELPGWAQALAHLTPLFHAVELVRQIALFEVEVSALWHFGFLVVMLGAGIAWGSRTFERRLKP